MRILMVTAENAPIAIIPDNATDVDIKDYIATTFRDNLEFLDDGGVVFITSYRFTKFAIINVDTVPVKGHH